MAPLLAVTPLAGSAAEGRGDRGLEEARGWVVCGASLQASVRVGRGQKCIFAGGVGRETSASIP